MYRCSHCLAGYNPRGGNPMDVCPRCFAKRRVAAPLYRQAGPGRRGPAATPGQLPQSADSLRS